MKRLFLLVIVICLRAAAGPQPANLIANIPGRVTLSLNGVWRIIVDPYETGLTSRFYEDRHAKDKQELVEYNFDTSPTIAVPGDWNTLRPDLFFYEGPAWYKRAFTYRKRDNVRTFIHVGAANYLSRVWLNGTKLGEHEGGFTPFDFEVTGTIRDGDNSLVVEVNNARRADAVPSLNTDWWNFGGITRNVDLVEVPDTFIRDYSIQLAKGSTTEISGWVQFDGQHTQNGVTIEIPEANIVFKTLTSPDGRAIIDFDVAKLACANEPAAKCPAPLQLWTPEHPKLYRVVISGQGDRIEEEIGFRTVEVRGRQILLNGKPIFLRGISMHEEAPFRGGRAFSQEDEQTLFGWTKELDCNFARLAHYPHNEFAARTADRLGVLLWEEVPVYWANDWKNPKTLEVAEEQMRDLVSRDKNRASVILWSIANETPVLPERLDFLRSLATLTRQLDGTRLITAASDKTDRSQTHLGIINDPLGELLDVFGLNEYLGWYWGAPADIPLMQWKMTYDKPLIISEFGADAPFGNRGDAAARWTEEYQADVFTKQIEMLQRIPSLAGLTPWVLTDFHSPRRFLPGVQDYYNRKGLISNRGQRKQAFYVLQEFYRQMEQSSNH